MLVHMFARLTSHRVDQTINILWLKRDLRVADNPALAKAVQGDHSVVPLYIVEPEYWQLPDTSARQYAFLRETLHDLAKTLAGIGAPLVVRVSDAVQALDGLSKTYRVNQIFSTEETGNAWTFRRDQRVAAWAKHTGNTWTQVPQFGVVRGLRSRDGWAASREKSVRLAQIDPPVAMRPHGVEGQRMPSLADLWLIDDCPDRQAGGRGSALSLLGGFLTERGQSYRAAMSSPLEGEWACSRMSPHLALGALSVREAAHAGQARSREVAGTRSGWSGSLRSFQSRLAWRDHFMQKLEDAPRLEYQAMHSAYENLRPKQPDAERLHAWKTGQTGIPFVDACMRYLIHTGWLNFRMRSMLMSVASYHLWLDWRSTGPHLAQMFTDYEPGIHWSQVQMQSGTTGINTVRMYNPVKQGIDQDPNGIFTRRWCPELAQVPDRFLQEPWRWDGAGTVVGKLYPEPIVDLPQAARFARDQVWSVRKGAAFRNEAKKIVKKHASRKSDRGFQRDKAPKDPDTRQMSFDI